MATSKNTIHPKISGANDAYGKPQRRDAYLAAVRDGLIPANNNSEVETTYEFTSATGKPHNTFNGLNTKYRPSLNSLNSDYPIWKGNAESTNDLDYYRETPVPYPQQRRAMSVEPYSQTHANTIERVRRDASKDRRKRNVSGDRNRRGVSVDRNAAHDTSLDRKREKSGDRTRSELNLNNRHRHRDVSGERSRHVDYSTMSSMGGHSHSHMHQTSPIAPIRNQNQSPHHHPSGSGTLTRREPASPCRGNRNPSLDDSDSDSDKDGGNYVRLIQPTNPPHPGRQASRQTSSESNNSVFERGTTPRNSNTSKGRPSFTATSSPGFTRVNYGDSSPHFASPGSHHSPQPLHPAAHHTSPIATHRNHSPNTVNLSSSSSEMNDYVNVGWKPADDLPDDPPPPRPPRPTKLDIKHQPNCAPPSNVPPKTLPRASRSQANTPQSTTAEDSYRTRFSPGGSPPPSMNHQMKLHHIDDVDDTTDKISSGSHKPSLPPKPCPGPSSHNLTPSTEYL